MQRIILLLLVVLVPLGSSEERNVSVPVTFKRVGYFATGIHYGHVSLSIDLRKFYAYVEDGIQVLNDTLFTKPSYYGHDVVSDKSTAANAKVTFDL